MTENCAPEAMLKEEEHHKQYELCQTRPAYRQGRQLTAIKTYTVNLESQHLCIYGVPQINLRNELKHLCVRYGKIVNINIVLYYKTEQFTECYHVQFERIQSARIAKRLLDNKSFYGGILHVCYAPEYESMEETWIKLQQRMKDVTSRMNNDFKDLLSAGGQTDVKFEEFANTTKSQIKKKRKHSDRFTDKGNSENNYYTTAPSHKRSKNTSSEYT